MTRSVRSWRAFAAIALLLSGPPAIARDTLPPLQPARTGVDIYVAQAAQRFGIPAHWIWAVIRVESAGYVRATSPAGAMGLMQIMPATWAALRNRYSLGTDPYEPQDNILAGAAYLREMHDLYGPTGMLAAYNAGPGRYEDYLLRGRALPQETLAYMARFAPMISASGTAPGAFTLPVPSVHWTQASLFAQPSSSRQGRGDTGMAEPAKAPDNRMTTPASPLIRTGLSATATGLFVPLTGPKRP